MPLLNRTPARVCIFRMFKAAREGFGRRTLGDMGTGKVKTGVRTSARFCISIFFDQHLIGIQGGGSSRLGRVWWCSRSAWLTLHFISHLLACKVLAARRGRRLPPYFIIGDSWHTAAGWPDIMGCPVRVRRHHRLSSPCLYFWFSVFEIKRRWQILNYCWDLKELPPHEGNKPFDEYKPAVRCCSVPHLA